MDATDIGASLLVAVVAAVSVFFTYRALQTWRVVLTSRVWPQVDATVAKAWVHRTETRKHLREGDSRAGYGHVVRDPHAGDVGVSYHHAPRVELTLRRGGREVTATNEDPWNQAFSYTKEEAEAYVARYVRGATVRLRVHPRDPTLVRLPGEDWSWCTSALGGAVGVVLSAGAVAAVCNDLARLAGVEVPLLLDRSIVLWGMFAAWPLWVLFAVLLDLLRAGDHTDG